MTLLATRQRMHGPLWTVGDHRGPIYVQLWAPNETRDHWALGWTQSDEDDEVVDQGYLHGLGLGEFPAQVPSAIAKHVGVLLNAATLWDPEEPCDHTRAQSFGIRSNGHQCGYCGRIFVPEPEEAA